MEADELVPALRRAAAEGWVTWRQHVLSRMFERGISRAEVKTVLSKGELIELYEKNKPFPSGLLMYMGTEPLHVVAALDPETGGCYVITVYRPDSQHFEADLKTRKR